MSTLNSDSAYTQTIKLSDRQEMIKELIDASRQYLNHFFENLDLKVTDQVVEALLHCEGNIFLTGIGKSGIVAKKIAATMSSTGTRALYLSPTNALHGDLGIVNAKDVCLLISKSGESDELLNLIPALRNKDTKLIAVVSNENSRLSRACQLSITLPIKRELCLFDKAPTTSTVIQLAFGDILAVALMQIKNFNVDQFALNHPAGRIGKRITLKVKDLMLAGDSIPTCQPNEKLVDVLYELSNKRCGCVLVLSQDRSLLGIFTDGDLRRALQNRGGDVLNTPMQQLMNPNPKWIGSEVLAWDAMKIMEADQQRPITVLPVLAEENEVIGLIKMHDILQSGL